MKKDTNYIAAVEKAIAEKYGKDTVQDFRSTWEADKEKEYLRQLAERNKKTYPSAKKNKRSLAEDVEVSTQRRRDPSNRQCPVCKTYSFSSKDDLYMNRFGCCNYCYLQFVHQNEDSWAAGKRPTKEQLKEALGRRK